MTNQLALAAAVVSLVTLPAFADDLPDPTKTPGAILETVPDEQVASCLSDRTGTNVQVDDPITTSLVSVDGVWEWCFASAGRLAPGGRQTTWLVHRGDLPRQGHQRARSHAKRWHDMIGHAVLA